MMAAAVETITSVVIEGFHGCGPGLGGCGGRGPAAEVVVTGEDDDVVLEVCDAWPEVRQTISPWKLCGSKVTVVPLAN